MGDRGSKKAYTGPRTYRPNLVVINQSW